MGAAVTPPLAPPPLAPALRAPRLRGAVLLAAPVLAAVLLAAVLPASPAAAAGHAASPIRVGRDSDQPIDVDAASSDIDYRTNTVVFHDIVITQGPTRLAAQHATMTGTGINFANSQWTFTTDVRINVEGGALESDKAVVNFVDNQVSKAVITGNPATFQQRLTGEGRIARGRAGVIEYDVRQGTVRLTGNAWLSDGRDDMTNQQIVYDIANERVNAQALARQPERVRITIRPRKTPASAPTAAPAPAAPGAPGP